MKDQETLLRELIERAKAKGLRPADDWERQYLDPTELYQACTDGVWHGPLFVRERK